MCIAQFWLSFICRTWPSFLQFVNYCRPVDDGMTDNWKIFVIGSFPKLLCNILLHRPHERGVQPNRCPGAHKSVGSPWTSKFKNEMGNYAQSFYCYRFIYTILCKLSDWSYFFGRCTMHRHFFRSVFGKISIAVVALQVQCAKYSVTCRNSRKYASWRHMRFYPAR